jgi:hypothetical protein
MVSAVGGDADSVALAVGEDSEAGAGDSLLRLDDAAAEAFGRGQRRGYVLDGDEEQHLVLGALPGPIPHMRRLLRGTEGGPTVLALR